MCPRRLLILAVILVVAACDVVPTPTPRATRPASAPPALSPTPVVSPTVDASAEPTPSASESAEPARPDPAAFLQVCRAVPGPRETPPIPCEDAVVAALEAQGVTAPTRVDVRFACGSAPACDRPDPDRAFVTVIVDEAATEVVVVRSADGGLTGTSAGPGEPPAVPAFTPPEPGRADFPGAPAGLAGRTAYPLCGEEQTPMGGPYDETARSCFLHGVLAGSPVEFASVGAGTEGGQYVNVYRYAGTGGIELVTGEGGRWSRRYTGIGEAGGGLVFETGGMSTAPQDVP